MVIICDNFDCAARSHEASYLVIPAKAGIQLRQEVLDPGFRRGDGIDGVLEENRTRKESCRL